MNKTLEVLKKLKAEIMRDEGDLIKTYNEHMVDRKFRFRAVMILDEYIKREEKGESH